MASRPDGGTHVYRIVSDRYPPFDGGGAYRWGSRWVDPGRLAVHAAASYSLAVLENLVHWQTNALPPRLICIVGTIPGAIEQAREELVDVRDADACRAVGNGWFDEGKSAVLWVPSIVSPYEQNVLINQLHPDFAKIEVSAPSKVAIDERRLQSS